MASAVYERNTVINPQGEKFALVPFVPLLNPPV